MKSFTVTVERGENYWVSQLKEDPGLIVQTKRLDQIVEEVRYALELFPELTDAPETAEVRLELVGTAENAAERIRQKLAETRKREAEQLEQMAAHARDLADGGYNYRDIAYLLGITYGRVGQILQQQASTSEPRV